MGALKGSASYLRFFVDGDPPRGFQNRFEKAIEARRFLPLGPDAPETESGGWVPMESPFDDELPITRDLFLFGDLIGLGFREDKVTIPRPLLQHLTSKKVAELEARGDKVTRQTRRTCELAVFAELRARVLPRSRVLDLVWDLGSREVRMFGRGPMATERAAARFEMTFGFALSPADYARRAFSQDLSLRARSVLEGLQPASFSGQ